MLTIKHSAKDETIEAVLGKARKTLAGKPIGDSTAFPLTLNAEEIGVKAIIDLDIAIDEYLVDINGEPYECLPYLDPSFNLEDTEIKTISGWIKINEKIVLEGGAEWQPYVL